MADPLPPSAIEGFDPNAVIRLQAEQHFSMEMEEFETVEAFCLSLMHRRAYAEALRHAEGGRVLDLGCNNGYGTLALAAGGATLSIGVDVSTRMLEEARRKRVHPKVAFMQVDGIRLPFETAAFDLITSFQVIEHIADYSSYLSEIQRTLRSGGLALFTTPNAEIRLDPGMRPWNMFHVHEFRRAELRDLLQPWFRDVRVMGLFAVDGFSSIERGRVSALREKARKEQARLLPHAWEIRMRVIQLIKRGLPDPVVEGLRRLARSRTAQTARPRPAGIPPSMLPPFTTDDLFYRDEPTDGALDLLAVCRA